MGMNVYFPKKQNQDAYVIARQVIDQPHCHFFAVLDGHGAVGKEITATVENRLAQLVDGELERLLVFEAEVRLNLRKEYPAARDVKKALTGAFD